MYADFSGACIRFAPEWEAAAKELEGIAKFGRVDLSSDPSFGWTLYGVGGSLLPGARQWPPELPFVIGLAPTCESLSCAVRFRSDLRSEALQLFVADVLLHLPQVSPLLFRESTINTRKRNTINVSKLLLNLRVYTESTHKCTHTRSKSIHKARVLCCTFIRMALHILYICTWV